MEGLTQKQYDDLVVAVGTQAAQKIASAMVEYEQKAKQFAESAKTGMISKEDFDSYKTTADQALTAIKDISAAHGTKITELSDIVSSEEVGNKSIGKVLEENEEELRKCYQNGSGSKTFMIRVNAKGQLVMKPFDTTKAAGPHASIADVGTGGNSASISQSIDAASLLRIAADSTIISNYRNSPWVFDLCNIVNAGFEMPFAIWYEEQTKQGASATVAEGASKPLSQFAYALKSSTYKKEATLLGFTEEFSLDFPRLQSDILGKGRTDLINRINTAILANIKTAATAYNTSASFGATVTNVNDFDVLAAMAAQVDNATFGALANTAVMSTFKKYRMGITKSTQGEYVDRPSVLSNLAFVGNPAVAADDIMVGDFKQYNIMLRGGLILRMGYNGTDFAENRFSYVLEQYYFDYISTIRKAAIVKGPDFATVAALIVP
jgi:hypothetical protein